MITYCQTLGSNTDAARPQSLSDVLLLDGMFNSNGHIHEPNMVLYLSSHSFCPLEYSDITSSKGARRCFD